MNLSATIAIYGGGPGSGCTGPNCGRPKTWDGTTTTKQYYMDENGHYTPDRAKLHDELIAKYEDKPSQVNPVMTVLVGGSASGKSTYDIQESAKLRNPTIVDVDKMRADLPEFASVAGTPGTEQTLDEARDIRDQVMMKALAHNEDIALEAVGHPDTPSKIDAIEKAGYKVNIVYVHRPVEESIALANKRAASSQSLSGRIKPAEDTVRENHAASRMILPQLMKPGREVTVYDGTGDWDVNKPYNMIYHRTADGNVTAKDEKALEGMRNVEDPKIEDAF